VMSPHETGAQWDFPYAWAPDQLVADEGIRKIRVQQRGGSCSYEFLSTVAENFRRDGDDSAKKYNRGDALFGNAGHRGISHEHRWDLAGRTEYFFRCCTNCRKLPLRVWLMSRRRSPVLGR